MLKKKLFINFLILSIAGIASFFYANELILLYIPYGLVFIEDFGTSVVRWVYISLLTGLIHGIFIYFYLLLVHTQVRLIVIITFLWTIPSIYIYEYIITENYGVDWIFILSTIYISIVLNIIFSINHYFKKVISVTRSYNTNTTQGE